MIAIKRKYSSFERARRMFAHNRLFMEYTFYTIESRFISQFLVCMLCVLCWNRIEFSGEFLQNRLRRPPLCRFAGR